MKERLSVTVDARLVEDGRAAVEAGQYESLSAWVSAALMDQSERDQRLRAADEFIEAWEAEYGEITEEDMERTEREMSARAIRVNWDEPVEVDGDAHGAERRTA